MKAHALAPQLRELAASFRRLASRPDDARAELGSACEWGSKLLVRLSEAGRLPFKLPPPKHASDVSGYIALDWLCLWDAACSALSHQLADQLPSNPHLIQWQERESSGAELVRIGQQKPEQWRARAENYARICDALADGLESTGKESATGDGVAGVSAIEFLLGDFGFEVLKIVRSGKNANDRLRALSDLDPRFYSYDSPSLANLLELEDRSGAAIRKLPWWKIERQAHFEEERQRHE